VSSFLEKQIAWTKLLSFFHPEADVKANLEKLKALIPALPLTDREFAILAVAVTELQVHNYKPFAEQYIVQVVL